MSSYGLIKSTSLAMRLDTTTDLQRVNIWLSKKGLPCISAYGQSVRALENSVALGLAGQDLTGLPKLERDVTFYTSIVSDIKDKEKEKFYSINKTDNGK